jgi:large subunit ribosomal protein L6
MGRIGKIPIPVPKEVEVKIEKKEVKVKGPKGELSQSIPSRIEVVKEEGVIRVINHIEDKGRWVLAGTIRALINNMIIGVTKGYEKRLVIDGKGYRVSMEGKVLSLQIGYPQPIKFTPPEGIKLSTPTSQTIVVEGIDKQLVGDVAAKIRAIKKPEPYKGKGIHYSDEVIRRKPGKKAGYGGTGA